MGKKGKQEPEPVRIIDLGRAGILSV